MSRSKTPTSSWVLPSLKRMHDHLKDTINNVDLEQKIRVAAAKGLDKLLVYYDKAINNQFLIIATSKYAIHMCLIYVNLP